MKLAMTFPWIHKEYGSFIGEYLDPLNVSLSFDSKCRKWTLRIFKAETVVGPVTYEVGWQEHYSATRPEAVELANRILEIELQS